MINWVMLMKKLNNHGFEMADLIGFLVIFVIILLFVTILAHYVGFL